MSWTRSLARLRQHEIEERRKRLAAVLEERAAREADLALLDQEGAQEMQRGGGDPAVLFTLAAWRVCWLDRKAEIVGLLRRLAQEEEGCREALSEAFAELKKVERVAAAHAREEATRERLREGAVLDEIALRRRDAL